MKKFFVTAISLMLVGMCVACGSKEPAQTNNPQNQQTDTQKSDNNNTSNPDTKYKEEDGTDMSVIDIEASINAAIGARYACNKNIESQELAKRFSLDMSKVKEFVAKESSDKSANYDMVVILRVENGYQDTVADAFNKYHENIINSITEYNFYAVKIKETRIFICGDIVAYIVVGGTDLNFASIDEAEIFVRNDYKNLDDKLWEIFGYVPQNIASVTGNDEPDVTNEPDDEPPTKPDEYVDPDL